MSTNVPKKLGKYDVLDVVGRGGMGIVYKAADPGIGRLVAIKMMTVGYADDSELLKRFYREAQSAGKLQHPNIVTIYDLGDQDGNPYMVMEFLEGESLDSIIASRRPVSLEQKLYIAIQVCNGLNYAHQHGVIHRDIKPANVMVLKDFTVKIVDFGIARIGNENVTRPGQLMGSIPYMSPEQIKDKAYVDSRTDIFSTGVLLYQFLTNELPFDGKDMGAILLKIIHDPPPSLQTLIPEYSPELDRIIALALAKNPDERYATADRLAFDLMRVQDELKRETVHEYLQSIDKLIAGAQWNQAKEQLLQLLRMDRQNSRANELLAQVDQQIQTQKRSEQARELRVQAEQAIRQDELTDALRYLDQAVKLDSSHELLELRNSVAERKARADQLAALLHRAESARDTGELEEAQKAVAEALRLEHNNREAQALKTIIAREIEEQNKLKQVQGLLEEARRRMASRSFTAALEVLKKAELLSSAAPGVKELANLAISGQEQERRRKQLEAFNSEIENALNRDDFVLACSRADEGLQLFPEDRGLLKLKRLAEKQRQTREKRAYVEAQIAASRQLMDSADSNRSLAPLEEALKRYPQEPALVSMLTVVKESLAHRREEQRKADCLQKARDAIRRKAYSEAIATLEETRKEISSSDLDDLLQFAQEEAATYATRQKIDAAAERARQFVSNDEYQSAIDLLEAILQDVPDEELNIILEDAHRRLEEFNQKVQETVATAQRLLRQDRLSEAVRFLEAQVEQCDRSPEFRALLEQSRLDLNRLQNFSVAKENAREALSKDDFPAAAMILQRFRERFGESPDTKVLQKEIETSRSRAATAAMEKALPDVRMLLMVRSFDSAEGILDSLSQWSAFAASPVKEQYEALLEVAQRAKAQRSASELAEKLYQAKVSDPLEASQESVEAGDEIGPTEAMDRTQLEGLLGKVAQIEDHYKGNQKVQSAIQVFKRRLTLRIGALEEEGESAPPAPEPNPTLKPEVSSEQPLTATRHSEQQSQAAYPAASTTPVEPQSDLTSTQQYAESTPADSDDIPEPPAASEAIEAFSESEQQKLLEQDAVRNAVQQGQDLLSYGQPIPAIQILQQAAAQYPGQSEIEELLAVAESGAQEQEIVEIERQARAQAKQGGFEQALSTLDEGLKQFPEVELLRKAREPVSAAQQRAEVLAEGQRRRAQDELETALNVLQTGLQRFPQDGELEALKVQIQSDQAQRQRRQAVASATEKAQGHLRDGQTILAIEALQRCASRFPDEESISNLLRSAEAQLRRELEVSGIRTQAETMVREGRLEAAVALLEENLSKDSFFEELLATTRGQLNTKLRDELLSQAALLQRRARYKEAQGLVQRAVRQHGTTSAAADLERTLQSLIEAERRQKVHDADRGKLLALQRQVPTAKQAKLKKLAARVQEIAATYAVEDENAGIAGRVLELVESQLATAAQPEPIPWRKLAAGAAAVVLVVAGIVVVPRVLRVTTAPVEIRTDPPGASVRVGDRSCRTPNCRLDLNPGQYHVEARLDGYQPAEQNLTVDSTKQISPINLLMQPLPQPPPPTGPNLAAIGSLVVQSGVPDALVFVDNTARGRTDALGRLTLLLETRTHQVRIEKPGYQTPPEQLVEIARAVSQQLTFKMDPLRVEAKSKKAAAAVRSTAPAAQENPQPPSAGFLDMKEGTEAWDWEMVTIINPDRPAVREAAIESYLKKYPNGAHAAEAQSRLQDLFWGHTNQNDAAALQAYLNRFPNGSQARQASAQMEAVLWSKLDGNSRQALQDFLAKYPNSTHRGDVQTMLNEADSREADKMREGFSEADKKGIQAAMDAFNAAFQHQQRSELKDIWPGVPELLLNALRHPGGTTTMVTLKLTGDPAIIGDTAVALCDAQSTETKPGHPPETTHLPEKVQLHKKGGRWLISFISKQ